MFLPLVCLHLHLCLLSLARRHTLFLLTHSPLYIHTHTDPSFRDVMAAEHPNDNLGIVPPATRSINLPSLWDALGGGGMVGDAIAMKKQREGKDNVRERESVCVWIVRVRERVLCMCCVCRGVETIDLCYLSSILCV